MLSGDLAVLQAPMFDGDAVDAGALGEDRFIPAEVGVGRRHVAQALIVSLVIIVLDEGLDLGFEIAGQKVVLQKLLSNLPAFGSSDMSGVKKTAIDTLRCRTEPVISKNKRHAPAR